MFSSNVLTSFQRFCPLSKLQYVLLEYLLFVNELTALANGRKNPIDLWSLSVVIYDS